MIRDGLAGQMGLGDLSCLRPSDRCNLMRHQVDYTQNYCISYLERAKSKRPGSVSLYFEPANPPLMMKKDMKIFMKGRAN